jgi:hypothetical protein
MNTSAIYRVAGRAPLGSKLLLLEVCLLPKIWLASWEQICSFGALSAHFAPLPHTFLKINIFIKQLTVVKFRVHSGILYLHECAPAWFDGSWARPPVPPAISARIWVSVSPICSRNYALRAFSANFKIWRQSINFKLAPLALRMSGNPGNIQFLVKTSFTCSCASNRFEIWTILIWNNTTYMVESS